MKASDAELIERCLRHEAGAFEQLYKDHAVRVYNLACRLSGSMADGEDLVQEIFTLIYRKLAGFKGEAALSTWIYRLATNHCLDFLRKRQASTGRTEPFDDAVDWAETTQPLRAEAIARQSSSTTWKGSTNTRSPRFSASRKARPSHRCTRPG